MEGIIHLHFDVPPDSSKISMYKVPHEYNCDWIEKRGDVLFVIECEDRLVVIIQE